MAVGCLPPARRALAEAGVVQEAPWQAMALCMSRRDPDAVFLLHVSKSGGSSVCTWADASRCLDAASAEGVRTLREGNCWSRTFDDGPHWFGNMPGANFEDLWAYDRPSKESQRGGDTCAERVAWARSQRVTFFAVESYMPLSMTYTSPAPACAGSFTSVIILRDPISRIFSHYAHIHRKFPTVREYLASHYGFGMANNTGRFNATSMAGFFPQISDNVMARPRTHRPCSKQPYMHRLYYAVRWRAVCNTRLPCLSELYSSAAGPVRV